MAFKQSVKRVVSMKYTDFVNSIQGLVKVEATDEGITAIEFVSAAESDNTANAKQGGIGRETAAQESVLSNDFHSQKNAITEAARTAAFQVSRIPRSKPSTSRPNGPSIASARRSR